MSKRISGGALEKNILYNRWVLYFIGLIALLDLVYLLGSNDFYSVIIFLLTGFLTSFFSKNMVVILSLAMSVAFIFKHGTQIQHEGFELERENMTDEKPEDDENGEMGFGKTDDNKDKDEKDKDEKDKEEPFDIEE